MREILFRGKRIDNGEWVYGFYTRIERSLPRCKVAYKHYIVPDYASALYGVEVAPSSVGHNTLIPDKNNNTIFEGHIIKAKHTFHGSISEFKNKTIRNAYGREMEESKNDLFSDFCFYYRNYVVEYSQKKGAYIARNGSDQYYLMQLVKNHSAEIIGNIHDKPELLKGE